MSIYTFVVDFGDGPHPAISKHTDILGGTLNAVQFSDALAELEGVTEQRDELLEALHEGRRAIGDHFAPNDCYATGPLTGDEFRDLVQCPACSFIAMYDAAIAKATGEQP